MITAITYATNTGHTKDYAELLGREINLPVYEINNAVKVLPKSTPVIHMGWLMAGTLKGYKKANKHFDIKCLCSVGMANSDSQFEDVLKINNIKQSVPYFYLQGGFELEKLHGIYKLMMSVMKAGVTKGLSEKQDRTQEEDEMLELMKNNKSLVSKNNLSNVIKWYKGEE